MQGDKLQTPLSHQLYSQLLSGEKTIEDLADRLESLELSPSDCAAAIIPLDSDLVEISAIFQVIWELQAYPVKGIQLVEPLFVQVDRANSTVRLLPRPVSLTLPTPHHRIDPLKY